MKKVSVKRRLEANRRSAAASRQRRLDLIASLQQTVQGMQMTITNLERENKELQRLKESRRLEAQAGAGLQAQATTGLQAQASVGFQAQVGAGFQAQVGAGFQAQVGAGFQAQVSAPSPAYAYAQAQSGIELPPSPQTQLSTKVEPVFQQGYNSHGQPNDSSQPGSHPQSVIELCTCAPTQPQPGAQSFYHSSFAYQGVQIPHGAQLQAVGPFNHGLQFPPGTLFPPGVVIVQPGTQLTPSTVAEIKNGAQIQSGTQMQLGIQAPSGQKQPPTHAPPDGQAQTGGQAQPSFQIIHPGIKIDSEPPQSSPSRHAFQVYRNLHPPPGTVAHFGGAPIQQVVLPKQSVYEGDSTGESPQLHQQNPAANGLQHPGMPDQTFVKESNRETQ